MGNPPNWPQGLLLDTDTEKHEPSRLSTMGRRKDVPKTHDPLGPACSYS
jgi:hypothetical protein